MAEKSKSIRGVDDYYWMAGFFGVLVLFSFLFFPSRTTQEDSRILITECLNPLHLDLPLDSQGQVSFGSLFKHWLVWFIIAFMAQSFLTFFLFKIMKWLKPNRMPSTYVMEQTQSIVINFILLALIQATLDVYLSGYFRLTKTVTGFKRLDLISILTDTFLWALTFELVWYTQHRLMHDNKFLWTFGHSFHHGWKKPSQMIGITNFSFDHIVEVWVTMSSSFVGQVLFPSNFYVGKTIALVYMVIAVAVHWNGFDLSHYHLNHHYLIVKNYGSHVPIFDIFFGTYQWDPYIHPEEKILDQK